MTIYFIGLFFNWGIYFGGSNFFFSSSYVLDISPLPKEKLAKNLFNSVSCLFTLLIISFAAQKPFNLLSFRLLILGVLSCAIVVLFRKSLPMFISSSDFPVLH